MHIHQEKGINWVKGQHTLFSSGSLSFGCGDDGTVELPCDGCPISSNSCCWYSRASRFRFNNMNAWGLTLSRSNAPCKSNNLSYKPKGTTISVGDSWCSLRLYDSWRMLQISLATLPPSVRCGKCPYSWSLLSWRLYCPCSPTNNSVRTQMQQYLKLLRWWCTVFLHLSIWGASRCWT